MLFFLRQETKFPLCTSRLAGLTPCPALPDELSNGLLVLRDDDLFPRNQTGDQLCQMSLGFFKGNCC